eukprot:2305151-Amphidinium_carterae.1
MIDDSLFGILERVQSFAKQDDEVCKHEDNVSKHEEEEVAKHEARYKLRLGRHHPAHQRNRALKRSLRAAAAKRHVTARNLQVLKHNHKVATRVDDMIPVEGQLLGKISGKGAWRRWLPSAALRCAFAPAQVSSRSLAKAMGEHISHSQIGKLRRAIAFVFWAEQQRLLQRFVDHAVGMLDCFVTSMMWDETTFYLGSNSEAAARASVLTCWGNAAKYANGVWQHE